MRRGRICPAVFERAEACTGLGYPFQYIEQVSRAASEPVKPRDRHRIAGLQSLEQFPELRAVRLGTRHLLSEYLGAAGGSQLSDLVGQVLVPRTDPRIAVTGHAKPRFRT